MKHGGPVLFLLGFATALVAGWAGFPRLLYVRLHQPLQFSHAAHSPERAGLTCEDCHSVTEAGYFTGVPTLEKCAGCHAEPLTEKAEERRLIQEYVKPEREIPWLVYSRQPQNVRFSHAIHIRRAELTCETCHGEHGKTETLRPYEENRISGYSRDIWGASISRIGYKSPQQPTMKMDDCTHCHGTKGVVTGCRACHK